jgi:hypothetical protein
MKRGQYWWRSEWVFVLAAFTITGLWIGLNLLKPNRIAPRGLADAARIARAAGFEVYDAEENHVVVSVRPLTAQIVGSLRYGVSDHCCWRGIADIRITNSMFNLAVPDGAVRWGELVVSGDPALVRDLTSRTQ